MKTTAFITLIIALLVALIPLITPEALDEKYVSEHSAHDSNCVSNIEDISPEQADSYLKQYCEPELSRLDSPEHEEDKEENRDVKGSSAAAVTTFSVYLLLLLVSIALMIA